VSITSSSFTDAKISQITATYRGTVTSNGVTYPVFDLSIPELSLTASNVRGDGTPVAVTGGQVRASFTTMNYTLLGGWSFTPTSGAPTVGLVEVGYSTPVASVPTTGSATYTGINGVIGAYAVPAGTGSIETGTLSGDLSLSVNFAGNTATGSLNNMKSQAAGSSTTTPWNTVALSGTLNRSGASVTMSGSLSTTTNTATAGFSSAAAGAFAGMLNGPTAQEVGGMWGLMEPTVGGGKAAFGVFGGKQ